jgi:predicted AAA+ superfamily ATPase
MLELIDKITIYNQHLLSELPKHQPRATSMSVDWSERLIGVLGAKGVGKTTLLLSRLQQAISEEASAIYLSLDHPLFAGMSVVELAEYFYKRGGKVMILDEVHKYPDWSGHIKAVYDNCKKLQILFSGSSAAHIHKGRGDLSRRANVYRLPTLSLREYIQIEVQQSLPAFSLQAILSDPQEVVAQITSRVSPLEHLTPYLEKGVYPFYQEGFSGYHRKLVNVINETIESDLVFINGLDSRYSVKLRQLLRLISTSVPFTPKLTDLAQALELSRPTVTQYLQYLEESNLIRMLYPVGRGYQKLLKPEKLYLDNTNLMHALGDAGTVNIGTVRETFALAQLREAGHLVEADAKADFTIDGKYIFEIGGQNKGAQQLQGSSEGYLLLDDLNTVIGNNKLPLWLLGFLY